MGSELNIYKIAQEAGVSPATVSRVMTKNARVSEEKRARVEAVIRKYDYRPNALAQGLIKTKTNVIGVLAADLVNPYYSSMVENCEKEIIARGYVPMIFDMRMDAIIIIGGKSDSLVTEPEYADLINRVAESIPVITTGKVEGGECCQVTIDEAEGMNQSMECLIGLGHRRIALIGGVEEMKSTYDKRIRYRSLLRKNGLTYRERYVINSNYSVEGGYQGFEALFQGNNDYSAVGVMRSIKEHGLRIPEDISLISFDNTFIVDTVIPRLSSISYDYEAFGKLLVDTALDKIGGKEVPEVQKVTPTLIIRESVAELKR